VGGNSHGTEGWGSSKAIMTSRAGRVCPRDPPCGDGDLITPYPEQEMLSWTNALASMQWCRARSASNVRVKSRLSYTDSVRRARVLRPSSAERPSSPR
jgi:hypothetical protein